VLTEGQDGETGLEQQGDGVDLVLAHLPQVVLVSPNILGVLTHTSKGQGAAGDWLEPGLLGEVEKARRFFFTSGFLRGRPDGICFFWMSLVLPRL